MQDERVVSGIKEAVDRIVAEEAGGIPQIEGQARLRCRLVRGVVEVFCVGKWRMVATGRKVPLTRRAFEWARRTLELNGAIRPGDELTLVYE